jgi:catechol 2,3-dioxygenase-like lactoylglutathione lyase family enzyme
MVNDAKIMGFIPSSDLDRSRAFYEGKLALRVLSHDGFAVAFNAGGIMVRVTHVGTFTPQKFTVFGWQVNDVAAAVAALKGVGIEFQRYGMPGQDDQGIWTAPGGAKIAWFLDPDGNVLSLAQFAE